MKKFKDTYGRTIINKSKLSFEQSGYIGSHSGLQYGKE